MAWPARIPVEGLQTERETPLKGFALAAALVLLAVDLIASLALSGRLRGPRSTIAAALALGLILPLLSPPALQAPVGDGPQPDDGLALRATSEVVLGHVITGDSRLDQRAYDGLYGLGRALTARTAIEPAEPLSVNVETDELSFFPILYWPISVDQPLPSVEAYAKLNRYLRGGGMIVFDTRDADLGGFGNNSPEGRKLQSFAAAGYPAAGADPH